MNADCAYGIRTRRNLLEHLRRRDAVPEAHRRQAERLRQRPGDEHVRIAVELADERVTDELVVRLVDHDETRCGLDDPPHVFWWCHRSRRVVRRADEHDVGLRAFDRVGRRVGVDAEIRFATTDDHIRPGHARLTVVHPVRRFEEHRGSSRAAVREAGLEQHLVRAVADPYPRLIDAGVVGELDDEQRLRIVRISVELVPSRGCVDLFDDIVRWRIRVLVRVQEDATALLTSDVV